MIDKNTLGVRNSKANQKQQGQSEAALYTIYVVHLVLTLIWQFGNVDENFHRQPRCQPNF